MTRYVSQYRRKIDGLLVGILCDLCAPYHDRQDDPIVLVRTYQRGRCQDCGYSPADR